MQATIVAGGEPTIDDDAVFALIDTGGVDGACVGYQRRSAVTGADASGACNRLPDAGRALSAVENGELTTRTSVPRPPTRRWACVSSLPDDRGATGDL